MDTIAKRISYVWRLLATTFCFAVFGLGGLVASLIWAPALYLFVRDSAARALTLRRTIHVLFRMFVGLMRTMGVLSYEITGAQRLRAPGLLVVATHPTLIDVVFLMASIPNGVCLVKQTLLESLPFGPLLRGAGYVGNAEPKASLAACTERLQQGVSVVLFPEGTRSVTGRDARLRRGTARVVMASGVRPLPVRISCDPPTLRKGERYYEIPERRVHFTIIVGEHIDVDGSNPSYESVRARAITERIRRELEGAPSLAKNLEKSHG